MDEETSDLTPAQDRAIEALLISVNVRGAAERAGVGERTLRRWLREDAVFIDAYRAARRTATEAGIGLLQQAVGRAAKVLIREMEEADRSSDKISAAKAVIRQAVESVELWELAQRMEQLERMVQQETAR